MDHSIARDAHCGLIMGSDIDSDIHCDITMGNCIAMYTYGITMHNGVVINLFFYVLLHLIRILLFHQYTI